MHLYGTQKIHNGHLTIGGVDTVELVEQYGTPLFVYDTALIRKRARGFKETFEKLGVTAQVAYASKAFACVAAYQLAAQENLSLDVVSGGELYTAIKAEFPADRIHFHGNNKSVAELEMAFDTKIGCIVVDNFYEIALLKDKKIVGDVELIGLENSEIDFVSNFVKLEPYYVKVENKHTLVPEYLKEESAYLVK